MKIYVANWADMDSLEADADDPPKLHELFDTASAPQFGFVSCEPLEQVLERAKQELVDGIGYMLQGEDAPTDLRWETEGWVPEGERGERAHQVLELSGRHPDEDGTRVLGWVTVQQVHVAGTPL